MPYFSVIIPVYNRYHCVRKAIDSVLSQTFADYELIVVDDGSTDDTPRVAEEYADRIRYLRRENRGVSAARNTGVTASTASWLAFLDSDDLWLPGKLERQARFIRENPGIMIHQTDETWIRRGRRVNPRERHLKREGHIFIDSLGLCLISPSAAIMSRECFDRYGPFDEDLPACEDYDLWLRVTARERVGLAPERLVVRHGGHADQLSARYPAMDRFRVYAILKLLEREGASLPPEYSGQAAAVAAEKARILRDGALKRKRLGFAEKLGAVMRMLEAGKISAGECRFLLEDD
jgi:glycosyltransferase involved in cell wall biosynthesis